MSGDFIFEQEQEIKGEKAPQALAAHVKIGSPVKGQVIATNGGSVWEA